MKIKSLKTRLFIIYTVILCLQMLLIWTPGFISLSRYLKANQEREFEAIINSIDNELHSTLTEMTRFSNSIRNDVFYTDLISEHTQPSMYDLVQYKNTFINNVSMNSSISEAAAVFPNLDLVISNFSLIESIQTFGSDYFRLNKRKNYTSSWLNGQEKEIIFMGEIQCGQEAYGTGIAMLSDYTDGYYVGQDSPKIVTVVYIEDIMSKIKQFLPNDTYILFNIGEQQVVYVANPVSADDVTKAEFLEAVSEWDSEQEDLRTSLGKTTYHFARGLSGYGIEYVVACDVGVMEQPLVNAQWMMILLLGAGILLGILFVYGASEKSLAPFNRILKILGTKDEKSTVPDYTYIETQVQELVANERNLMQSLESSRYQLQQYYLGKLMHYPVKNVQEMITGLRMAGITLERKGFLSVIYRCDLPEYNFADEKMLLGSVADSGIFFIEEKELGRLSVLLNFDDSDLAKIVCRKLEKAMQHGNPSVMLAIGSERWSLTEVYQSYADAVTAFDYKTLGKSAQVYRFGQDNVIDQKEYAFPVDQELLFLAALKAGKYEDAEKILADLIHQNVDITRLSVSQLKDFYVHVLVCIFKAYTGDDQELRKKYPVQYVLNMQDHNVLIGWFESLIQQVCESNLQHHADNEEHSTLIEQVKIYLKENYDNPNLNLTMTADAMGVHKNYLSSTFNEKVGCSFVEYVNRMRIDHALNLFPDMSLSVSQIAERSGFSSDVTFRREFKKYMGVTPGQYRKQLE